MEAKATITNRLDGFDAEAFAEMLAGSSFAIFRKRIERELERSCRGCETSASVIDIHRSQGQAAAFRTVLAMPAQILDEMRSPKK